jgi:hypothetical protein
MNQFQGQLAAFEQYMHAAEPKLAPQVTAIIDTYYRNRVNFGDATTIDSLQNAGLWLDLPDDAVQVADAQAADAAAATNTTGILNNLFSTATNLIQNGQSTQAQIAKLNAAAQVQQAAAVGAGQNKSTMLLIGGAVAAVALVALVAGSGQGGRR